MFALPLILRWLKPSDDCPRDEGTYGDWPAYPIGALSRGAVPRPVSSISGSGEKLTLLDILTDAEVVQFVRTVGGGGCVHAVQFAAERPARS